MYAVIETGGKQYRVEVGSELEIELLEAAPGESITLDRVLLVADGDEATIGRPVVTEAAVEAEVVRRDRGEKVIAFKYRPKARRRVKKGHRQQLSVIRITDVRLNGKSAAEEQRKADADARSERQRLEEAAARQAAEDAALAERLAKASPAKSSAKASEKSEATAAKPRASKPSAGKASATGSAKSTSAPKRTTKAPTAKADAKTPKAKTQSGAADAKPKASADKPRPKPRATKKDE